MYFPSASERHSISFLAAWSLCTWLLCVCACQKVPDPALTQLGEARNLASELRIQFAKSVDASDRAVLADNDDASAAFANEATRAVDATESARVALATRLESMGYREETKVLDEFGGYFAEYRKLQRQALDLAVANTNRKAQRMSFGPLREAADTFRDALFAVSRSAPPKDACRIDGLVARATLAVREIQVLQAPHIAEAEDAAMDQLEKQMASLDSDAHQAMAALSKVISPEEVLSPASAALAHFDDLSRDLVALSRQNSNVRSLSLAVQKTPALVALCDNELAALNTALGKRGFNATR